MKKLQKEWVKKHKKLLDALQAQIDKAQKDFDFIVSVYDEAVKKNDASIFVDEMYDYCVIMRSTLPQAAIKVCDNWNKKINPFVIRVIIEDDE